MACKVFGRFIFFLILTQPAVFDVRVYHFDVLLLSLSLFQKNVGQGLMTGAFLFSLLPANQTVRVRFDFEPKNGRIFQFWMRIRPDFWSKDIWIYRRVVGPMARMKDWNFSRLLNLSRIEFPCTSMGKLGREIWAVWPISDRTGSIIARISDFFAEMPIVIGPNSVRSWHAENFTLY